MRSTIKRGQRAQAIIKMRGGRLPETPFGGAVERSAPQGIPGLSEAANEPDNFCRIEACAPLQSRMPLGEGDATRPGMSQAQLESDPSGVNQFFQALLATGEFDSACPRTAEALSQLRAVRHLLRVSCSSELAESGRFDPLLRQLLAHLQAPLCEALESGSEGCDR